MKLLIFRTLLIYLCVLFAMRLMGKRQLGELQPEDAGIHYPHLKSGVHLHRVGRVPVTASLIPVFSSRLWSCWGRR